MPPDAEQALHLTGPHSSFARRQALTAARQVSLTKNLLLESLYRLQQYASELGHESDVNEYVAMIVRVEKRMRA
jgi:hypothetical protein